MEKIKTEVNSIQNGKGNYCEKSSNGRHRLPFLLSERADMCKQRVALDMIEAQHDHGGMSDAALLLHKKQCEDTEQVNKRIDEIDNKIDRLEKKIDEVMAMVSSGSQFAKNLKEILSNKVFLYILITLICACFGVSVGEVGTFLFRG